MIIEIQLSELNVGHFVTDIAKQNGTFTLSAPGHIKSINVINNLRSKQVISVFIDDSKTLPPPSKTRAEISAEAKQAVEIFNESKDIQKKLFAAALNGTTVDLQSVVDVTNKSVDAIFNSPDSLACMVNIREKDEYLLEHSVAVSVYMTIFAHHLKMNKKVVHHLSIGAFLHDIGKIKIPDEILNKPGKLTDEEFTIMKTHANHSIDIIKKTPGISKLSLDVAALHHEKLNGEGYPFQVEGKNIHKYGRMIAICDIFDALTANRCYKDGFSHIKSFNILRELAKNNHLDGELVEQFIRCIGVFPTGTLVQLESKKLAVVEQRNCNDLTKPKVKSFYSVKLNQYLNTQDIDLAKTDDFIVKGVRAEDFDLDMNTIITMLLMEG
ncbi:HD-GYP domain-containing protein [Colwellia sp. 4_MG-2023]|jgi:HD-GYP domain-containing protein (c-di-GMP phosphodiesterase class II)|uniref:HD-GYP domain-containing protein n=1 Tax=unclassified Colwellia TaxID=196834 RepID=UPI001C08944F|nr:MULTISPECIES: HD-GYP domain-containing protein [unclassified Colwellia]MBU2924164.1 HD-GYP domain-containing protein [Colwellia sp. C2M11]MDO6486869.1 HD-GYP domain-containing protein [Colwellia sp. 6_MG-2023]MDO6506197.1 HD-GYP domain-containing protein [Colwellia sp. 5_MG-2023]MDO6554743.1 HD-GYP domain-containing protein [Colwellia sp. 4_MG-2023]MDO6652054.1 HD-GYP domain-containing protein [Colwellia sp. 3_MG-2023]